MFERGAGVVPRGRGSLPDPESTKEEKDTRSHKMNVYPTGGRHL